MNFWMSKSGCGDFKLWKEIVGLCEIGLDYQGCGGLVVYHLELVPLCP